MGRVRLYLDHNATSPLRPEAREAWLRAADHAWGNPHSPHGEGRAASAVIEGARREVAALVDRPARQVHFTSGATEANAWVLRGLGGQGRVLVSAVEHPSVLAWGQEQLPVDGEGLVRLDLLDEALGRGGVAVVSVMAANNETGVLQPWEEVGRLCRAHGVPWHCDATQLPGRLPVTLEADHLSLSAHKLGGPKGVGCLVSATPPEPLLRGGPQERGVRAGTPAVAAIAAFGAAARVARSRPPMAPEHRRLMDEACEELGGTVLSKGAPRLPNTTTALFSVPGDLVVMALDLEGVAASTGAACSSGSAVESHVLAAMGHRGLPVRLSSGPDSPLDDVVSALSILRAVVRRLEVECGSSSP